MNAVKSKLEIRECTEVDDEFIVFYSSTQLVSAEKYRFYCELICLIRNWYTVTNDESAIVFAVRSDFTNVEKYRFYSEQKRTRFSF